VSDFQCRMQGRRTFVIVRLFVRTLQRVNRSPRFLA
jgi:hypothetical protein